MRDAMNRFVNRRVGRYSVCFPTETSEKKPIKTDKFCFKDDTFPARRRNQKQKTNRSCFVSPETHDFSNFADNTMIDDNQDARVPENVTQLKYLLFEPRAKVESQSQSMGVNTVSACVDTLNNRCRMMDSVCQVELIFNGNINQEHENTTPAAPKKVIISETPKVKMIAEQFYKFKKNDIELRKLDEKIVCVEYDVFDEDNMGKPPQSMRVYFSIKSRHGDLGDVTKDQLEHIKQKLELPEEYLNQPTNNEIEIIDGQIPNNQSYLEDIKLVLRRHKETEQQKKKSSLDLKTLYQIAKHQQPILETGISKEQLQKAKEMILQRCKSSIHGMTRRRVKPIARNKQYEPSEVTKSILNDLLSESGEF